MQKIINKLVYLRVAQILVMMFIGLCFYRFSKIPHSWWLVMTIYLMLSAIEPGLVKLKSLSRAKGTLIGLILFLPSLYLLELNYRFIPLYMMVAIIFANSISPKRYDIAVIFITLSLLSSTAYNYVVPTAEGPLQMEMNRGINTLLAITIVFIGEFFIFRRFGYAHKTYYLYQLRVRKLLVRESRRMMLMTPPVTPAQNYNLLNQLSGKILKEFNDLVNASEGLLKISAVEQVKKDRINNFNGWAFRARKELSALYYAIFVAKNDELRDQIYLRLHEALGEMRLSELREYIKSRR